MDEIKVNEGSLERAKMLLNALSDNLLARISECEKSLGNELELMDDSYKKTLLEFISSIKSYGTKVKLFSEENTLAINDRLERLREYEGKTYYRRTNI